MNSQPNSLGSAQFGRCDKSSPAIIDYLKKIIHSKSVHLAFSSSLESSVNYFSISHNTPPQFIVIAVLCAISLIVQPALPSHLWLLPQTCHLIGLIIRATRTMTSPCATPWSPITHYWTFIDQIDFTSCWPTKYIDILNTLTY